MAINFEQNPEPSAGGRVVDVWSLPLRHPFLILFLSAVGSALGYLYFLKTPPVYQSSCSLLVRNESNNKTIPFQGVENANQNQRDQPHALLIVSPLVIDRALDKPLGDRIESQNDRRLRDLPCFSNVENETGYITARLTAKPSIQSGLEMHDIVNLTFRDSDAMTCKSVLNAVVESYRDFLGESHKNVSQEVLELIQQARTTLLTHLTEIEAEYTQFRQDTPLLFNGESRARNIHKDRMNEIETARARLMILLTERRAELQSITDSLARGASREAITLMLQSTKREDNRGGESGNKSTSNEIFQLMLEEQLLLTDLGPDHPKVKALQKKIALTQDYLLSEMPEDEKPKRSKRGDYLKICIDSLRHEISAVESKILELDELFESERHSSKSISVYEVKNENFQKELQRTEVLYQGVVKRLDELDLLQDYGGYKTSLISPPRIGKYVAPSFVQSLLFGALFGCAVGVGLGYLAEASDKTYRSPEEVSDSIGLPIIGHIPAIPRNDAFVKTADSRLDKMLVTFLQPKSRIAESYRAVRTSLFFSTRGEQHKVIQVTSPNPGDGKTTLSTNLAVSIAQTGKRVILIDADFRDLRIHQLFGLEMDVGVSSVINGDAELPDAIQPTEVENLWVLPCGPRPNNPCELLTSRRFEEFIDVIREQYDFVIIDTPPLLAVTDPGAVAARVDGVILTLRLNKRSRIETTKATEQLRLLDANILGVVVNGLNQSTGYGYSYGKYSGYAEYGYGYYLNGGSGPNGEDHYYSDDDSNKAPRPMQKR